MSPEKLELLDVVMLVIGVLVASVVVLVATRGDGTARHGDRAGH